MHHQLPHQYSKPGNYEIEIEVTDEDTKKVLATPLLVESIVTSNEVDGGGSYAIAEGESLTLEATAESEPVRYDWDFNNDTITDATSTNPNLTLDWAALQSAGVDDSGTYDIQVTAVYEGDIKATSPLTTLTVANVAPSATLNNGGSVDEGSIATVFFSNQSDIANADNDLNSFRYSYDFDNDGTFEIENSELASVTVPANFLDDNGIYTVRAVIADKDGDKSELFTEINVLQVDPTLTVTGADTAVEGANYNLQLSSTDPGNDAIAQWVIDWGDGNVSEATVDLISRTFSATHKYLDDNPTSTSQDTFTIVTTVTDDDGGTVNDTSTVLIENVVPVITAFESDSPVEDATVAGESVTVTGSFRDFGSQDTFTAQIDWGDGSVTQETVTFDGVNETLSASHIYQRSGNYQVSWTIQDDDTAIDTMEITVYVLGGTISGTSNRDVLRGSGGAERFDAGTGNDVVYAYSGNDIVDGGDGNDYIYGHNGNDILNG